MVYYVCRIILQERTARRSPFSLLKIALRDFIGGGYGHHHYKISVVYTPKVRNSIIYPLNFARMYIVK